MGEDFDGESSNGSEHRFLVCDVDAQPFQPSGKRADSRLQIANLLFGDGDFRVVRPGSFVRCGVTGQPIPLDQLRYWNIERQEAYVTIEAKLQRLRETAGLPDAS